MAIHVESAVRASAAELAIRELIEQPMELVDSELADAQRRELEELRQANQMLQADGTRLQEQLVGAELSKASAVVCIFCMNVSIDQPSLAVAVRGGGLGGCEAPAGDCQTGIRYKYGLDGHREE